MWSSRRFASRCCWQWAVRSDYFSLLAAALHGVTSLIWITFTSEFILMITVA